MLQAGSIEGTTRQDGGEKVSCAIRGVRAGERRRGCTQAAAWQRWLAGIRWLVDTVGDDIGDWSWYVKWEDA
jgi:hypothetical protein